ncbi:hypothetical protein OA187_02105 [Candidatus Pelagibacter sp.]|nr:hypothetical protein [Candidatus Pelagibacter sp.]
MFFIKIVNDIINILNLKKIEKNYLRVFFFENLFIENHIVPYTYKNKQKNKSIIITLYNSRSEKLKNFKIIKFNYLFFLEFCFLILKIKYIYSSTPNLNSSSFRKSAISKNKYIYIQHSPVSLTMVYSKNAFTEFDIVLTISSFQKKEILEINDLYKRKIKPWKSKYLFSETKQNKKNETSKKILIAPTWGTNFFKNNLHIKIKEVLKKYNYQFELRPHYMTFKKDGISRNKIRKEFLLNEGNINFNDYHTIITDWSGIFIEFAKVTSSKCVLLKIPKKKLNNDFELITSIPTEVYSRDILSYEINESELENLDIIISKIITEKETYKFKIENFFKKYFF